MDLDLCGAFVIPDQIVVRPNMLEVTSVSRFAFLLLTRHSHELRWKGSMLSAVCGYALPWPCPEHVHVAPGYVSRCTGHFSPSSAERTDTNTPYENSLTAVENFSLKHSQSSRPYAPYLLILLYMTALSINYLITRCKVFERKKFSGVG